MKLLYVDCGANTGRTIQRAIGSGRYDRFVAIEPNPELRFDLWDLACGSSKEIHVISRAVWTCDGLGNFYLARTWGQNYQGGSTLLSGKQSGKVDYERPIDVKLLDFPKWLQAQLTILGDQWRAAIKMDIEGAEYAVLEAMLDRGLMPLVAELRVEFHAAKFSTIPQQRHDRLLARLCDWAGPCVPEGDTLLWRNT